MEKQEQIDVVDGRVVEPHNGGGRELTRSAELHVVNVDRGMGYAGDERVPGLVKVLRDVVIVALLGGMVGVGDGATVGFGLEFPPTKYKLDSTKDDKELGEYEADGG